MTKKQMESYSKHIKGRVERYAKYISSEYSAEALSARIDAFGAAVEDAGLLMDPFKDQGAIDTRIKLENWLCREQLLLDLYRKEYPDPKVAAETYWDFRKLPHPEVTIDD